jgi:hypothetical protein
MNLKLFLFIIFPFLFLNSCKDLTTEPLPSNNSIVGTWEYSGDIGFTDITDPANTYFPKLTFNSYFNFEESARFVKLPSKEILGYKYVKTGSYNTTSDTITLTIKNEIYVNFEDSLQVKPSPLPVNPYNKKYKFIVVSDTLKMALVGVTGIYYINYFRK